MARMCCIESCEGLSSEDVTYFPFPVKPALRRRWHAAVAPARLRPEPLLCSRHFAPEQCQTVRGKLRLRANVVPTLFARNGETLPLLNHTENNSSEGSNGKDSPVNDCTDETALERVSNNTEDPLDNSNHDNGNQGDDKQDDSNPEDRIQDSDKEHRVKCKDKSKVQKNDKNTSKKESIKKSKDRDMIDDEKIMDQETAEDGIGEIQDKSDDDKHESMEQDKANDDEKETLEQDKADDDKEESMEQDKANDDHKESMEQDKANDDEKETLEQDKADDDKEESMEQDKANDDHKESMEQDKVNVVEEETLGQDKASVDEEESLDQNKADVDEKETLEQDKADDDKEESMEQDEVEYISLDQFVDCSIEENVDENCTIECMPEAILGAEDDSSEPEEDPHRGDIEDIIANYHIKQDKKLAARLKAAQSEQPKGDVEDIIANYQIKQDKKIAAKLKAAQEKEAKEAENRKTAELEAGKRKSGAPGARARSPPPARVAPDALDALDDDSVEFVDSTERPPVFVEISVDADADPGDSAADDCMMLLEKVQVDIDPSSLFPPEPGDADSDSSSVEEVPMRKPDPISLLTSSDSDEVIIEEPRLDTVDVSDETDEDDVPLVKLAAEPRRAKAAVIRQIMWGTQQEYYCYRCNYTSATHAESVRHQLQHQLSTVINVCQVCGFSTASDAQFARHKKKHKEEKRFKCHLCDYRAKHKMSLSYHVQSHGGALAHGPADVRAVKRLQCSKCKFVSGSKAQLARHRRRCGGESARAHACARCAYATSRRADLRRHVASRHRAASDSDEYVPPRGAV